MELIKSMRNLAILGFSIAYFGGLAGLTCRLGMSALDLHQKGLFSLAKYNRMLVGPTK